MNILFRADSSSFIGTGHIMRDLVLAKSFKNSNITFATQNLKGNINHKIAEVNFKKVILKSNSFTELDKLIKKLKIDMVVIDNYDIDYKFEKKLKESNPNLTLFVFDDTYEKHYCDILLNHNISANPKRYKSLVPKDCELRCGEKYTLLREEFYIEKTKKQKKDKKKKRIFIAMGGADTAKLNIPILKILETFSNIQINIVTTLANKNLKKLQKYCKAKKWINLHINSNKIAKLMAKSDLAIVTPSVTVNEVYFMKRSFIAIKTASNQDEIYKFLKKKRSDVLEKFNKNKLEKKIKKYLDK